MSKKESILKAATWLFAKKGFKDASMAELSKLTGAAEGTIFYHFKNKETLFLAVLETVKLKIINDFNGYTARKHFQNGLKMVEEVVSFYLYLAGHSPDLFMLLHRHDAYELAEVNPICREYLEDTYNGLVDIFEKAVNLGKKDGTIGAVPARKMALILFTLTDGLVRFNSYNLYNAGALSSELIASCRRMLASD
ncbi:MAG: TetR/AcrR family transcriptional regulator [Deltaproteobacteria bacterium]|nr:TetR/AcrR family transcriptional regulator [Deltaproteobacteria bacterium]